jgi:YbgC/YbaW family acyl-CoA thioester hydrolase
LRSLGLTQAQLRTEFVQFVVSRCTVEYRQPARLDDDLRVTVGVRQLGYASITFRQEVYRATELLCAADVKVACIHSDRMQPVALPAEIRRQLVNEE